MKDHFGIRRFEIEFAKWQGRTYALSHNNGTNALTAAMYGVGLGPGDEIIIDVWGINEATIKQRISPEGRITISQVGPITLSGLTIEQAENILKKALSVKYSLNGPNPSSHMSLTLGNIRSIQVHVMGEVKTPGTYRLSSLSSVFNALYFAGGITDIGSVRNIKVFCNIALCKILGFSAFCNKFKFRFKVLIALSRLCMSTFSG